MLPQNQRDFGQKMNLKQQKWLGKNKIVFKEKSHPLWYGYMYSWEQ